MKTVNESLGGESEDHHVVDHEQSCLWPFPITNGARNNVSQRLLEMKKKPAEIKFNYTNEQEALV